MNILDFLSDDEGNLILQSESHPTWPTVGNEILKGKKLRDGKLLPNVRRQVRLTSASSSCPKKAHKKSTLYSGKLRGILNSPSNLSYSPHPEGNSFPARLSLTKVPRRKKSSLFSTLPSQLSKEKKLLRCPLRIAELAEPRKRQCLDTWRDRSDTLPAYVLDKLKQQLMNQKVVANISDAENCFKTKYKTPKRYDKIMGERRAQALARQENDERTMFMNFSALFANNIAKKLNRPMKINLTNGLLRLSEVVAEEIGNLLERQSKYHFDYMNDEMLMEITNKVTVWMADVLECADVKMTEDALRAKKLKENRLGMDGKLGTLIENHIRLRLEGPPDLEEEEGPVLDLLDVFLDKVIDICLANKNNSEDVSGSAADTSSDSSNNNNLPSSRSPSDRHSPTENYQTAINSSTEIIFPTEMNSPAEFNIRSSNITQTSMETSISGLSPITVKENVNREHRIVTFDGHSDINANTESQEQSNLEITDPTSENDNLTDANIDKSNDPNYMKGLIEALINEASFNVSDNMYLALTEDLFDAERKVKFTNVAAETKPIILDSPDSNSVNKKIETWNTKPNRLFASPNTSLLRIADELWPEEISKLRISGSESKSVTSLGQIKEIDETNMMSEQEMIKKNEQKLDQNEQNVTVVEIEDEKDKQYKDETDEVSSMTPQMDRDNAEAIISSTTEGVKEESLKELTDSLKTFSGSKNGKENDSMMVTVESGIVDQDTEADDNVVVVVIKSPHSNKTLKMRSTPEENSTAEGSRIQHTDSIKGIKDYNIRAKAKLYKGKGDQDADTDNDPISKAIQRKLQHFLVKHKPDYKVDLSTAPSWVHSPNEQFSYKSSKAKKHSLANIDFSKWCKDLEYTLINLEQWALWIDRQCNKMIRLKYSGNMNNPLPDWIKLKMKVKKDRKQWGKLYQCTLETLKEYDISNIRKILKDEKNKQNVKIKQLHKAQNTFEAMNMFDELTLWMHKLIVSTEYCVKCRCKYYSEMNRCWTATQRYKTR